MGMGGASFHVADPFPLFHKGKGRQPSFSLLPIALILVWLDLVGKICGLVEQRY